MLSYLQDRLCPLRSSVGKDSFQEGHGLGSQSDGSGSVIGIGKEIRESRTLHAFGIDAKLFARLVDKSDSEPMVDQ